jgi:hypothetical protein
VSAANSHGFRKTTLEDDKCWSWSQLLPRQLSKLGLGLLQRFSMERTISSDFDGGS